MDELIKESMRNMSGAGSVSALQLVLSLITSVVLSAVLSKAYMMTHGGYSYSKSYVQALTLITITITLIMVIIGSNIARAFALVGAMSIVRFRNPIKDSRDLVFIFMAMAIGMASGTQHYLFALIFTLFVMGLMAFFEYFQFGQLNAQSYVIKVRSGQAGREEVLATLGEKCLRCSVVSVEQKGENEDELICEISLSKNQRYDSVVEDLRRLRDVSSIQLLVGESGVNV